MTRAPETILVVEDAETVRKMVCAMLMQSGYNCLEAADGAEAVRLLEGSNHVQLVLTDMVMPNMSGSDLANHLSRTRPELRIVFMSGYPEEAVVRRMERAAPIFLAKPFTAAALQETIRQALDRPWKGLPELRRDSSAR
jgi:two-component system, cell cycle sensor histidine kinase and response regulator CckA